MTSDNERLKHNPEKGLSGGEPSRDKKKSKKNEKNTEKKRDNEPENRKASFFKRNVEIVEQPSRGIFYTEKDDTEKEIKHLAGEAEKQNEVESKEVKNKNSVKNGKESDITEAESRDIASHVTQARQEDIADNLTRVEQESPEEAGELAAAAYLTNVERHLGSGEDLTEEMLDNAERETLEDLEYDPEDIDLMDTVDQDAEDVGDENDDIPPEVQQQKAQHTPGQNTNQQPPQQSPSQPSSNNNQQYQGPPNGPPQPPIAPPPGGRTPLPPNHGNQFFNVNLPPVSSNHNIVNSTHHASLGQVESSTWYRRKRAKHLLIGGIVGYVIGRRGGRKRTEKRLQPEIDKLEHEISKLHDEIALREEKIRLIAIKHAEDTSRKERETKSGDLTTKPKSEALEAKKEPLKTNKERIQVFVERQQERQKNQDKRKTTERLHAEGSIKKMAEVHLAGLNMFVERRKIDGTENHRKRFEQMSDQELKVQAKDIVVDGVNVVDAYNDKRIDKQTLLETTKRYWRKGTGSYETVVRSNIKPDEKELSKHREKLEQARAPSEATVSEEVKQKAASEYAREIADDFYNKDPFTLETDEEKQAYFQCYAEENAQASELGTLMKKAQNGSLIKWKTGWIVLLFVVVIALVIWFISGSLS